MKFIAASVLMAFSLQAFAREVTVDVTLNPMGNFTGKTTDVKGEATKKGDEVSAQNIVVNLKNLKTKYVIVVLKLSKRKSLMMSSATLT